MSKINPSLVGNRLATRADAQQLARDLFEDLVPAFSTGRARVRFADRAANYGRVGAELEGFSRPLWGIAPLVAGGGAFSHLDMYIDGLSNGTDPGHEDFWGAVGNYDQRAVEMAAIGYALALAPDMFWAPLSSSAKTNLAAWLKGIEKAKMHDDNWHFFVVMVQEGLRRVGVPIDAAVREYHLACIESYYLGEGWYGDGPDGYVDHYNGYALHTYALLLLGLGSEVEVPRMQLYRDRACQFAPAFRYWFGDDGRAVPFGRSMTYRFGMASVWGALAVGNVEALPWGEIRGLWARNVRSWLNQPIADEEGRLTLGYSTSNPLIVEEYSSPNSPYWAMKALLPLSLPDNHPFWRADEAPYPELPPDLAVPAASFVAHRRGGNAILLPGAPPVDSLRNAADKYAKFAYASAFGFAVESDRWLHLGYGGDNVLALSPDGRHWRVREAVIERKIEPGRLRTRWSAWEGCQVETVQVFIGEWELRAHRLRAQSGFHALESGFAVAGYHPLREEDIDSTGLAVKRTADAVTALVDVSGGRLAGIRQVMPNTNLVSAYSSVPVLQSQIVAGDTVLAALVFAQPGADDLPPIPDQAELERAVAACFV